MERIAPLNADEHLLYCQRALGKNGRLSTAIPGFSAREAQITLCSAIVEAIEKKSILVAEAGTGTGKTFAYLLPSLTSNKKTLISTATKTLQDQLFHKDLPQLLHALGKAVQVQNLKGRSNYICRYRVQLHLNEGRFSDPQCAHDLAIVAKKMSQMVDGERSELPEIAENSSAWNYVTSTADNCLGTECSSHKECFLVKARKRALEADVVVINHHLFFADSQLKEEGFGELLPGAEVIVFDEAHQLPEIATHFHGHQFSTRQLQNLIQELIKEWPALDVSQHNFSQLTQQVETITQQLLHWQGPKKDRILWKEGFDEKDWQEQWFALVGVLDQLLTSFSQIDLKEYAALQKCQERVLEFKEIAAKLSKAHGENIAWIECYKQSISFHLTPLDIAPLFAQLLAQHAAAYVFTSATLTMASDFSCFTRSLGLEKAQTLLLPSPFDFQRQALLYLPRSLPDPKHSDYYPRLIERMLPVIEALKGRCFFLFTSHRALKEVAQLLHNNLNYPLLVQGDEAKPILLERFRRLGNAVLLGTATFWEGVDVKGETLSCVIIDKLPFASPVDPLVQGKLFHLKKQGLSGFDLFLLPSAVLALKQGIGRLIRDDQDKGVLIIADPRLTSREYGRQIFLSLPPLQKTREEKRVLSFIEQLSSSELT